MNRLRKTLLSASLVFLLTSIVVVECKADMVVSSETSQTSSDIELSNTIDILADESTPGTLAGALVDIAEVEYSATTMLIDNGVAVPEPTSVAFLLALTLILGLAIIRRRPANAVA